MSAKQTVQDRLEADFAESWRPEPDDRLIGVVDELGERDGGFGAYPIVSLVVDDGSTEAGKPIERGERRAFHAMHDVAASELAKIAPKPGDVIGIRYAGKHGERGYHKYRITSDALQEGFSWSKYRHEADGEGVSTGAPLTDADADTAAALGRERDEIDALASGWSAPVE